MDSTDQRPQPHASAPLPREDAGDASLPAFVRREVSRELPHLLLPAQPFRSHRPAAPAPMPTFVHEPAATHAVSPFGDDVAPVRAAAMPEAVERVVHPLLRDDPPAAPHMPLATPSFEHAAPTGTAGAHGPLASLTDFHLAVSDRRTRERDTVDRRRVPRPYASPWMAGPEGSIDPRPVQRPAEQGPTHVGPIATVMPDIPEVSRDGAPMPLEASVAITPGAGVPALPLAHAPAPVEATPTPAAPLAPAAPVPADPALTTGAVDVPATTHPAGDPLGVIFATGSAQPAGGMMNPAAWMPPVDAPTAQTAPATAPAPAAPSADPSMTFSAPVNAVATPAPAAAAAMAAPVLATPVPVPVPAPQPAVDDVLALQPLQPAPPPPGARGDRASMPVRALWLVAVPAGAGVGIGYLLSLVLS